MEIPKKGHEANNVLIFRRRNSRSLSVVPNIQTRPAIVKTQAQHRMEYPASVGANRLPSNRQRKPEPPVTNIAGLITCDRYCLIGKKTYRLLINSMAPI